MIRVAFRQADSRLFAKLICWWQGHDAAHCEVAGSWTGDFHDCLGASFLDKGVRLKSISMPPAKWRVYEVDLPAETVLRWHEEHKGHDYDVLGLFGFLWRPVWGRSHMWFCSELVADVLGLEGSHRYDVATIESVCARFGRRVQ